MCVCVCVCIFGHVCWCTSGVATCLLFFLLFLDLPSDVTELQELVLAKENTLQSESRKADAKFDRLKEQAKRKLAIQQEKHEKEMVRIKFFFFFQLCCLQVLYLLSTICHRLL